MLSYIPEPRPAIGNAYMTPRIRRKSRRRSYSPDVEIFLQPSRVTTNPGMDSVDDLGSWVSTPGHGRFFALSAGPRRESSCISPGRKSSCRHAFPRFVALDARPRTRPGRIGATDHAQTAAASRTRSAVAEIPERSRHGRHEPCC